MKVLITGANGFIGKNLVCKLKETSNHDLILIDKENTTEELVKGALEADFIFHLAGINRPKDDKEFFEGNSNLTTILVDELIKANKTTPILITSSIQAELDNAYGKSKKYAEEALEKYNKETGAKVLIYRLPNVFGKWCRPNYNSAVATFCHNIARGEEVWISDPTKEMTLVYIDDVIRCFVNELEEKENKGLQFKEVDVVHKATLGKIVDSLNAFKAIRKTSIIPNFADEFTKVLHSTYLSYLEEDNFSYTLDKKVDNRGWLAELIKSKEFGQIFISKTKPGITRGNHYHHTKVEKFLVIQGNAEIKFRKIDEDKVITYTVDGENPTVLDIPIGYTHSITNIGNDEVITLFWSNEIFDQEKPDTFFLEV